MGGLKNDKNIFVNLFWFLVISGIETDFQSGYWLINAEISFLKRDSHFQEMTTETSSNLFKISPPGL